MKKKTFKMMAILWVGLFLVSPVWAACQGITKTGKDGHVYCASNPGINWWSAFAWCEAQGRKLVSLKHCNGINGNITGDSQCPNFSNIGFAFWTSSVPNSIGAYYISSSGGPNSGNRSSSDIRCLCE